MRLTAAYCAELERVHVQPLDAAGRTYEVERRAYHAGRPGFRIVEMQIGPTQTIPWHYHSKARDTFYVLSGSIRVRMRARETQVVLAPGESYAVAAGCPHSVENAGAISAVFLILQGIGEHDFIPLA
jgi:mannose-6-phosphate isomerase-like protein (cupin superfamily)